MKEDIENILNRLENCIKEPFFIEEDYYTGESNEIPNFFCLDPTTSDCKTLFNYINKLETNRKELKKWLEDETTKEQDNTIIHKISGLERERTLNDMLNKMQEIESGKNDTNNR